MGKPTAADLRLGLATAPVLFAAQKHLELNPMIMRRFSEEGTKSQLLNVSILREDFLANYRNYHFSV
jgi:decaprenyl-diphosphate synthase subunit 1